MIADEGGTPVPSPVPEEHAAAFVPAKHLHNGFVHQADRTTERRIEVETHPSASKIVRLDAWTAGIDSARITD